MKHACIAFSLLATILIGKPSLATNTTTPSIQVIDISGNTTKPSGEPTDGTNSTTATNPHDPNNPTMLDAITPDDNKLSTANKELLAKNAELSFAVDNLTTQVNVLTQERSGQLFTYGAMTAIFSMITGFVLAKFIGKNNRW